MNLKNKRLLRLLYQKDISEVCLRSHLMIHETEYTIPGCQKDIFDNRESIILYHAFIFRRRPTVRDP
jgi:hypothetical protein